MITNSQVASTTTTRVFLASNQQAITTMLFCNISTSTSVTVDVYVVPNGSNASASTQVLKALPLAGSETFTFDTERLILENNDAVFAQASVGSLITVTVSSLATGS